MVDAVSIGVAEDVSSATSTEEPKQKRKYTRRAKATSQIDPKKQQQLHQLVTMLATAGLLLVPFQYRPMDAELQAILLPLERIYLRHAPETELNPDITDGILCILGIAVYLARITTTRPATAATNPTPLRQRTANNAATNPTGNSTEYPTGPTNPLRSDGLDTAENRLAAIHRATWRDDSGNGGPDA